MKLPDEECARAATSGWIAELDKALFDDTLTGPEVDIVRTLLGALKHERKRSAELTVECDGWRAVAEINEGTARRDTASLAKLDEVLGKNEELRAEVGRMRTVYEAARWVARRIDPPGDWACAECKPHSDMLHINPGFKCAIHAIRAAFPEEGANV